MYGKLSDIIGASFSAFRSYLLLHTCYEGRKPILFASIFVFLVCAPLFNPVSPLTRLQIGSALCGAAQDMTWLVVARAVQGIGGGGIIQLVQITISDIVSLQEYVSHGIINYPHSH